MAASKARRGVMRDGKAQDGYYSLGAARRALDARIDALTEAIPKGSVILDLGCNDGTISNALLEAGAISKSYGFDLEDILQHRRREIEFRAANMETYDLTNLPDADGVLILNLLHHIVRASQERAKHLMDYLLQRYSFVIIDMGSFTEQGEWHWRRAYDTHWKSDAEMWNFLFAEAEWRFKLLRYPTQGHGQRTLWKLYHKAYDLGDLETIQTFKRPPAIWPESKQLIPTAEVGETHVADTVEFELAKSTRGDKFWVKRYLGRTRQAKTELEMQLATRAAQELAALNPRAFRDIRIVRPVSKLANDTLVFLYEPDIFAGSIVHFQDWPKFFTPEQCRATAKIGTRPAGVDFLPGFSRMKLLQACDFQVCSTWDGVAVLDFEPNSWLIRLRTDINATPNEAAPTMVASGTELLDETLVRIDSTLNRLKDEIHDLKALMPRPQRGLGDGALKYPVGATRTLKHRLHRVLSRMRSIFALPISSASPPPKVSTSARSKA